MAAAWWEVVVQAMGALVMATQAVKVLEVAGVEVTVGVLEVLGGEVGGATGWGEGQAEVAMVGPEEWRL